MKNSAAALRRFPLRLLLMALAAAVLAARAQVLTPYDPCADPGLSMQRTAGGRFLVKWQAPAGATQLYWAASPGPNAGWQPVPGAIPLPGGFWQAEFLLNPPRAFFRVYPAAPPVPPPNVRLVMTGDHFRLEWDSTCDASVPDTAGTEPPDHSAERARSDVHHAGNSGDLRARGCGF